MAQYILNMGGRGSGSGGISKVVDVFEVTDSGVVNRTTDFNLTLSVSRYDLAAASCGNYILPMGGRTDVASVRPSTNAVDVFHVTDSGIEKIENHGLVLSHAEGFIMHAATSCKNYIFVMGGNGNYNHYNGVDVFEVTDTGVVNRTAEFGLTLSKGRERVAAASAGNFVLAMGGVSGQSSAPVDDTVVDVFEVTDSGVTRRTDLQTSLSVGRQSAVAASVGNYILAMGGHNGSGASDAVDVFHVTDSGVIKVENHGLTLSHPRHEPVAASVGNYILAMGGEASTTVSDVIDVFEVTSSGVIKVENHNLMLSHPSNSLAAASAGNFVLAMGGIEGNTFYNTVDIFQLYK